MKTENLLSAAAGIVLALGLISSIACFIIWGFGLLAFVSFFASAFSATFSWLVLRALAELLRKTGAPASSDFSADWEAEFKSLLACRQEDKARALLYKEIYRSPEMAKIERGANEIYKADCLEKLNARFRDQLKAVGESEIILIEL